MQNIEFSTTLQIEMVRSVVEILVLEFKGIYLL